MTPCARERYLTVLPANPESPGATLNDIGLRIDGTVLHQFVFGDCRQYASVHPLLSPLGGATTWLQGDPCRDNQLQSIQLTTLSGVDIQPVMLDRTVVGYAYEDDHARYCRLGGILPASVTASREEQARSMFERMAAVLASQDLAFTDTVRTWLYLDRLLDWYGPFNQVRTAFFEEQGVFEHMVPASTGIGAGNPAGAAVTSALIAIRPKSGSVTVRAVPSPLQCPALDYRSSFSRAAEVATPHGRTLYISGTASIDCDGNSLYLDDPVRQIDQTMCVVEAILTSRGMTWANATRGVAYYKDMHYQPLFANYCTTRRIPAFPLAVSHADICRDDLLFELELDAATSA